MKDIIETFGVLFSQIGVLVASLFGNTGESIVSKSIEQAGSISKAGIEEVIVKEAVDTIIPIEKNVVSVINNGQDIARKVHAVSPREVQKGMSEVMVAQGEVLEIKKNLLQLLWPF